jgi:hypothetical protein
VVDNNFSNLNASDFSAIIRHAFLDYAAANGAVDELVGGSTFCTRGRRRRITVEANQVFRRIRNAFLDYTAAYGVVNKLVRGSRSFLACTCGRRRQIKVEAVRPFLDIFKNQKHFPEIYRREVALIETK